jgi:hypothetical protein
LKLRLAVDSEVAKKLVNRDRRRQWNPTERRIRVIGYNTMSARLILFEVASLQFNLSRSARPALATFGSPERYFNERAISP